MGEHRLEVGLCYKDAVFNELVVIDGSTTDSTRYMWLTVAPGQRHNGIAGSGVVWKNSIDKTGRVLQISDPYTRVEWLEFDCSSMPSGDYDVVSCQSGGDNVSINNIIVHDLTGDYANAFEFWSGGTNSRMETVSPTTFQETVQQRLSSWPIVGSPLTTAPFSAMPLAPESKPRLTNRWSEIRSA